MSAWGAGIATYAHDKILEVFYPAPKLGGPGEPLEFEEVTDELRGTRQAAIVTTIEDLQAPPRDTPDAYLRLHLLSHRLVKPREINMDGRAARCRSSASTSSRG
jgi:2,3,4,5-tetrahydropyridine-2-carboxylate N-succinyltransferase